MLVLAVARRLPRDRALPIVRSLFPSLRHVAAVALGEIGDEDDIAFLRAVDVVRGEGELRQVFKRAIAKIERRLKREAARETKAPRNSRKGPIQ